MIRPERGRATIAGLGADFGGGFSFRLGWRLGRGYETWIALDQHAVEEGEHLIDEAGQLLERERLGIADLLDAHRANARQSRPKCGHQFARPGKVGELDLHERAFDGGHVEGQLAVAGAHLPRRDHLVPIGDRPVPLMLHEGNVLQREDDRRQVVERRQRRHADAEIAVLAARMHVLPAVAEERGEKADRGDETLEVAVQDEQLRQRRDEAHVARARQVARRWS